MKPPMTICRRCALQLSRCQQRPSQNSKRWLSTAITPLQPGPKGHQDSKRRPRYASTQPSSTSSSSEAPNDIYITSLGYPSPDTTRVLLQPDNLFHPFTRSPARDIRRRAAVMRQQAYCPHPDHHRTRYASGPLDPENRKPMPGSGVAESGAPALAPAHVSYECPDCGIPVSCCEEHYMDDFEAHLAVCDTLREANEDDHDLQSGRFMFEFQYPGTQRAEEFIINMTSWDTFLYTRDFNALDEDRSMRHVTKLLTYPITIATALHELSPYEMKKGGRLTGEGLRSLGALRYSLHPPPQGDDGTIKGLRPSPPPIRIFVLGARAESSLPREVWLQLIHCFPRCKFHLVFVGPESMANRDREFPLPPRTPTNPFGAIVEDRLGGHLKISTYVEYWHTLYERGEFGVFDPYFDVFVAFHPGFGHPATSHEWEGSLPGLLETKCSVICTGYTEWDMERDRSWIVEKTNGGPTALNRGLLGGDEAEEMMKKDEGFKRAVEEQQEKGEVDILIKPGENIFRSLRWDINDLDPTDISCGNWGVWAFRGKRYEATFQGE